MEAFRLVILGMCTIGIAIATYCIGKAMGYYEGYDRGYNHTLFTAKQAREVKDVIERNWHDLTDEYGMGPYWSSAHPEDDYDWQAIADELNAMMEAGASESDETESVPF